MEVLKQAIQFIGRLAASGAGVAAVILLLAGGTCLWRGGCTLVGWADTVIDLSLLAAAAGALAVMGSAMLGSNPNYQVARTASATPSAERTQEEVRTSAGRLSCTLLLAAGGIEAAAIGFLIKALV
jgi:hypothetical protein